MMGLIIWFRSNCLTIISLHEPSVLRPVALEAVGAHLRLCREEACHRAVVDGAADAAVDADALDVADALDEAVISVELPSAS